MKEMTIHHDYFYRYAAEKLIYACIEGGNATDENMRKGFTVAKELLKTDPQNEYALYICGLSFIAFDEKDPLMAYEYFTKILVNNPNYINAIYMRGYCLLEIDNPREDLLKVCLNDLSEAISKNKNLSYVIRAYELRGMLNEKLDDKEAADYDYRKREDLIIKRP